jgi:DNA-binding NarL/FixJ family response regulator
VERRAQELGARTVLARTRASLRGLGIRRTIPQRRTSAVPARQREVLALVAEGATTREIGRRLGLAPDTVEATIRAAMRRLGARTRIEAATMAARAQEGAAPPSLSGPSLTGAT